MISQTNRQQRTLAYAGDAPERTVILDDEGLRSLRGFTQIPNVILKHPKLSSGAKIVFAVLLSYAWEKDFCWPAQRRLAADTHCSVRQVQRLLAELKTAGIVTWTNSGLNRPNIHRILHQRSWKVPKQLNGKDTTDSSHPDATRVSSKADSEKNIQNVNTTPHDSGAGAEEEQLGAEILDVCHDPHSTGMYRRIARRLPHQAIFMLLAQTKDDARMGRIRMSPGAHFTDAAIRYARRYGCDIGISEHGESQAR